VEFRHTSMHKYMFTYSLVISRLMKTGSNPDLPKSVLIKFQY